MKNGTEHPRMWHPARYRRMHRTHDSEPYPRSIYGLKSPHTVGQIFHTHQLYLFIVYSTPKLLSSLTLDLSVKNLTYAVSPWSGGLRLREEVSP